MRKCIQRQAVLGIVQEGSILVNDHVHYAGQGSRVLKGCEYRSDQPRYSEYCYTLKEYRQCQIQIVAAVAYMPDILLQCFCQGCMMVLSMTLVASLTVYSAVVLPKGGYYFNQSGLSACDPFYTRPSIRILAACSFYFPTTMLLMYCYGSAFHAKRLRIKVAMANDVTNSTVHKVNFFQNLLQK